MAERAAKKKKRDGQATRIKQEFELAAAQPITKTQERAFSSWDSGAHLFQHGYAGTGKTFVAIYLALRDIIKGKFRKLYIVRSAVPSRTMGFLPGNEKEKVAVFEGAYRTICAALYNRGDAYEILKQKGIIEFITTSYLRGLTLDNCVIFADEIQNMNGAEINTLITRCGEDTRVILSGDINQTDLNNKYDITGLPDIYRVLKELQQFTFIEYGVNDIVRSDFVRDYIVVRSRLESEGKIATIATM